LSGTLLSGQTLEFYAVQSGSVNETSAHGGLDDAGHHTLSSSVIEV
jgi:hypothetical protein